MHANLKQHKHHSSSFNAPSRNANNQYELGTVNRSRSNFDDICDETWPLDEVINKIELKSDSEENGHYYNVESNVWRSGPQLISDTFNSARDMNRIAGNGTLFSSFHQGSKTWKDTSVKHRKYKTKKGENSYELNEKSSFLPYDSNNNYFDINVNYDDSLNFSDDHSPTLRDVGIQCNLKKFKDSNSLRNESVVKNKPPIKVIKSSNNGVVSAFSDVPKLSSPNPIISHDARLELDEPSSIRSNDVIYSQIDKNHKNRNHSGNINIVYKQPLNDSFNTHSSFNDSKYDVKTKEFRFNMSNPNFQNISLPNPNESLLFRKETKQRNRHDKEILEETISISNSSTDESSLQVPIIKQNDNFSMTSKSSSNYRKESPLRNSYYDGSSFANSASLVKNKEPQQQYKIRKQKKFEDDENVLLENNSLRLKSSKSPYTERLHKSNSDLREQFMRDETRGGLAAAYKNRQQKNQNRQRTLSLNRMNAMIKEEHANLYPTSVRHVSSNFSDLGRGNIAYPSSSPRSRSMQHERDPIVMYIPPVNHQRVNESPKLISILRNNSTKSNVTLQSKTKKLKQPKSQSKINLKEIGNNQKEKTGEKKADLNRRYSIPKDTKFNWFSKLRLKSK